MEAPDYFDIFLNQDFRRGCQKEVFCFSCGKAFCKKCCPSHATSHHQGQACRIAEVKRVRHCFAVIVEQLKGTGYDLRGVQRLRESGNVFIPLTRQQVLPGHRMALLCTNCGDRTHTRCLYCCTSCRLQSVAIGHRYAREKMETLVRTEFGEQVLPNCFCTTCCILFSSNCCTDHAGAHHHHQESLIHLVRHENLILTPVQDLVGFPEGWMADIQKIELDGDNLVPVCRMEQHHPLLGEPGNLCINCMNLIGVEYNYCSLFCKAHVIWFQAPAE